MLYKKNNTKKLDMDLFKNPTSEYRATPFWSWNDKLNKELLIRQIGYLKEMGFGGFHMHSRSGMATEYLSEDFFDLIKACRDKAKDENMLAWLYDEDRWSSGSAGGYVTKNKAYRQKMLCFSENKVEFADKETGVKEGLPYLLAVYDISLNSDGTLKSYKRIGENDTAKGTKRYAYVKTAPETGWYNNQTYVDTLSEEAIAEFIKTTHEAYKKHVGEDFGGAVPAIFTDEPNFNTHEGRDTLNFAESHNDLSVAWTTDFADTFKKYAGFDLLDRLPELFWELPDGKISNIRWLFYNHVSDRFANSFSRQIGQWCDKNGIALTGHLLSEENLTWQSISVGECMRSYPHFGIPGVDMLCNHVEFTTAKQTQSIVHQSGKEAMTSELYGVSNWDFDFRGHKFQGDWQAALGVTVRVPHLSWVSMKGSAKRDYPASINYQSPWYKEYPYIENHFARLNTVLTRGKPIVDVCVIHPIESLWLHLGPADQTAEAQKQRETEFQDITKWLLTSMIDFDFVSEALLPSQHTGKGDKFDVGCMSYSTVIVPGLDTMRRSTFEALKKFREKGGKVLFVGNCPKYIDAIETDEVQNLYASSLHAKFDKADILNKLDKDIEIYYPNGTKPTDLVHCKREDNGVKWLFIAHCVENPQTDRPRPEVITITLNGSYIPEVFDTVNGEIKKIDFETKNDKTYIYTTLYSCDSLLLRLTDGEGSYFEKKDDSLYLDSIIDFKQNVAYQREEDNVYLLDMAEYKLDDGEFNPLEEIIRIDDNCRKILKYPLANGEDTQPWVLNETKIEHYVTLKFTVESQIDTDCFIAAEEAKSISLNGKNIELSPCGYFVDESIKKYHLGSLHKGTNIIEIAAPIGKRTSIENFFLLGDFDVVVRGAEKTIIKPSEKIGFGNIATQGLPFYGGNLTYKTEIETPECSLKIRTSRYRGAAVKVIFDGKDMGIIAFKPYKLTIDNVSAGKHTVEFKLLGNRYNTFGPMHKCGYNIWYGSCMWYTYLADFSNEYGMVVDKDAAYRPGAFPYSAEWCYEYNYKDTGILASPMIEVIRHK